MASVKGYLATWVELFRTRMELLTTELEEERERVQQAFLLATVAVLCLTCGALLATLFVVVAFWETPYRLAVLGGFALLYFVAGGIVAMLTRRQLRNRPKFLAASLGELSKDYQQLSSRL
ncbi:MAG: phage holin family protein [Verrucomicrobiota bacterium]